MSATRRVLIVDTDPNLLATAKQISTEISPDINVRVSEGPDAFSCMAEHRYDLLLINVKLQKANGIQILRSVAKLRPANRPRHVIILSEVLLGNSSGQATEHVTYLSKPITPQELRPHLVRWLSRPVPPPSPTARIDADFVFAFAQGVLLVFKNTVQLPIQSRRILALTSASPQRDIAAVLSFASQSIAGQLCVSMNEATHSRTVTCMLNEPQSGITRENADAIAELANQIYGYAKIALSERRLELPPSLPRVYLKGDPIPSFSPPANGGKAVRLSLEHHTDAGPFWVELHFSRIAPASKA